MRLLLRACAACNDVQIDRRRIVHHVGVVLTGENVTGAAHVGRQLVNFVKPPIDHISHKIRITKIADHEIIGLGFAKARKFKVRATNPESLALEPLDQMMTDEPTGAADQRELPRR